MRLMRWPLLAILVAGLMTVGIAAAHGGKGSTGTKGASAGHANGTDRAFIGLMIPHHEGGVELGELAAEKGTNREVVRLGKEIVTEQSAELELLESWAKRFGVTPRMPEPIMEHDMMDMAKLRAAPRGAEFDRLWLDEISMHHAAAIQMALMERNGGRYGPAVELAESIVTSQSAQLEEFNELLTSIGG
jgi:uncharacterized protein (DUF305 family)